MKNFAASAGRRLPAADLHPRIPAAELGSRAKAQPQSAVTDVTLPSLSTTQLCFFPAASSST